MGWWIGGGSLFALGLSVAALLFGIDIGRDRERADQMFQAGKMEERARQLQAQVDQDSERAAETETIRQTEVREIYREVPQIINRDVYRGQCIDADGLRLLDRAAAAANSEAGPEPAAAAAPAADASPAG